MTGKEQAFPISSDRPERGITPGMDLRTYIATKAMAAIIGTRQSQDTMRPAAANVEPKVVAARAVAYADALIAELSK